jgi:hypothetical protein
MPSDGEPRPMATPPWGTPHSAPPGRGAPGPDPAPYGPREDTGARFQLVIEQTVGSGESRRWSAEPLPDRSWPSRLLAQAAAEQAARTFAPRHPMRERRRVVYRITPDQFVTVVEGMTSTSHFRVSVGERLD